jgi:WD40 repeat protein
VLFDVGRELHLLSLEQRRTDAVLQNPSGTAGFNILALFSPDGSLVLSGQGPDVRLQLWQVPGSGDVRCHELRQLVWPGSPTTCAAFSPHRDPGKGFLVTGTRDGRVVTWPLPTKDEIGEPIRARIIAVEEALSSTTREVRVQAEILPSPTNPRLVSGNSATIVIKPVIKP